MKNVVKKENALARQFLLTAGDSYSIPANIEHSIEIIEAGQVVDVFTPIRQDYL